MNRKKEFIVKNGFRIIPAGRLNKLIQMSGHSSVALLYHAVSDRYLPHISNLYRLKTTKEFINDIDGLLKIYKPVDLHTFISEYNKDRRKSVIHFTFDDGLREFYETAAPILYKKGIPATCFLNSAFIDNKDLFFRYKASFLIDTVKYHSQAGKKDEVIINWKNEHKISDTSIVNYLLQINQDNQYLLDDLASKLEIDFKKFLTEKQPYMTSPQIMELKDQGFTFGGHSLDHPRYNLLQEKEQLRQTIESINSVVKNYNLNYKVFAFPFTDDGVKLSFFSSLQSEIKVTTFGCAGLKDDIAPKNIQRVPVEGYKIDALNILKGEYLYFYLLKKIRKNTIVRN